MPNGSDSVLLLLGGVLDPSLYEFARSHSIIVCADSGAEHARALGLTPHSIVGDLDSISADTLSHFESLGVNVLRIHDQNRDDFEKALEYIASFHHGAVTVLGLTGLRTDHALTNLSVMLRWSDRFHSLIAVDSFASYQFLTEKRNKIEREAKLGQLISLMPFGVAKGVKTENLQYGLSHEDLALGEREGLSNVAMGSPVRISIESGALLVIATRQ
jgi:thiamine pyrophosphokinase